MPTKKILVTGSAGFIGMHTAIRLAQDGHDVVGIDNLNTYYSVDLKLARLREQGVPTHRIEYNKLLQGKNGIRFAQLDITDEHHLEELFTQEVFDIVIHLAAQAGVRYSIENPHAYIDSNVKGFLHILESCRKHPIQHLVFASSSSVYGNTNQVPFSEAQPTDTPVSLYAATKKANEAMAHSYASVHKLPVTGLRFFTVYGPWGRPDMALFKFTEKILAGEPIDVYNHGHLSRDFTYIDDIVEGIVRILDAPPSTVHRLSSIVHEPSSNVHGPSSIYNIGRGEPIPLNSFITAIEQATGKQAIRNNLPMQPGDVERTFADVSALAQLTDYQPGMQLEEGVRRFVEWYVDMHTNKGI